MSKWTTYAGITEVTSLPIMGKNPINHHQGHP